MNQKGFSLMEMLLVVVLMAIILAGLAGVQSTILQQKGRVIQDILVQSQADMLRKKILMDLSEATMIISPPVAASGADLQGYKNVDPGTNKMLITGLAKMYYFRFCAAQSGSWNLYYYWGQATASPFGPPSGCPATCGSVPTNANCSWTQLGGGPTNAFNIADIRPCLPDQVGFVPAPTKLFQRPRNNYIQAALSVKFDAGQTTQDKAKLGKNYARCSDVGTGMGLPLPTVAP